MINIWNVTFSLSQVVSIPPTFCFHPFFYLAADVDRSCKVQLITHWFFTQIHLGSNATMATKPSCFSALWLEILWWFHFEYRTSFSSVGFNVVPCLSCVFFPPHSELYLSTGGWWMRASHSLRTFEREEVTAFWWWRGVRGNKLRWWDTNTLWI